MDGNRKTSKERLRQRHRKRALNTQKKRQPLRKLSNKSLKMKELSINLLRRKLLRNY